MTLHERADKLLSLREDLYEMHFHQVDREWLIEAMVDFAQLPQQEISDEEIEEEISKRYMQPTMDYAFRDGCKWYREQLKCKGNDSKSKN